MSDNSQYVERRLQVWADWYSHGCGFGLGYPSKNLMANLQEMGGLLIKSSGETSLPVNACAEEIEKLVGELAQRYRSLAECLREYYLGEGTMRQKAKRQEMSYAQFKICVDKAKVWLDAKLETNK